MTPTPSRPLAIALALGAAACLVAAALTHAWLLRTGDYDEVRFGLLSNSACGSTFGEADCNRASNAELVEQMRGFNAESAANTSGAFAPMGWATLVELLLAAFGLTAAAGIAIARKRPDLPITPPTIAVLAIIAALITGCVFVATKPGPNGYVGVGWSFWLFGVGCVVGILAANLLAKVNRPLDPDLLDDAMNPDQF